MRAAVGTQAAVGVQAAAGMQTERAAEAALVERLLAQQKERF